MRFFSFDHWPLRAKTLVMLLGASSLPVLISAMLTFSTARDIITENMADTLSARADQLVAELEGFQRSYLGVVSRLARLPAATDMCTATDKQSVHGPFDAMARNIIETDGNVAGVTLSDKDGNIIFESEGSSSGSAAQHELLKEAFASGSAITDVYLARPNAGALPLISYTAAIHLGDAACLAAVHVRANAFWDTVRSANGRAGEGAYTVVLNEHGVRIAHSFRQDQVFRASAKLAPEYIERLAAVDRYGDDTRHLLESPVLVADEYSRATSRSFVGQDAFYSYFAPETGEINLAVARRMKNAPWTVFAIVPERVVSSDTAHLVQRTLLVSAIVVVFALGLGVFFSERIARPLRKLANAADALGTGNMKSRVTVDTRDEFGQLATTFNRMADAIAANHETLEARVIERTLSLERANEELQAQKEELVAQRTELQAQQRELQLKNAEVERAGQLKTDFLANMSHELRTPLNSIIGFSELLVEQTHDRMSEREMRYLNDVLTSGRHLLSLINDILDLSKIEAGHSTLDLDNIRPSSAITEAHELVHTTAMRRKIDVRSEIAIDVPVRADAGKLRQILLNLLSNALKFSPEGTHVTLGTEDANGFVCFYVRDVGPGIDEALRSRLFQPFVQGENALVKSFQGTGLGLAICKKLVEQHGGTIEIASAKGEGATFRFTIPKAEHIAVPKPTTGDHPLVLVIDDDRSSSNEIRGLLETAGYDVKQVDASHDAAEMVHRLKPAVLVLNPAGDNRDGLRILDELKRRDATRATPVVVTAAPRAADFVPKPIETQRFLAEIKLLAPRREGDARTRILAIDDDPTVGVLLTGLLEPSGYDVITTERGRDGIAIAQKERPAVIIVDLLMPEMSGFEVIDVLVADEHTRGIPIIVLTAADTSDSDRTRMKQHVRAIAQKGTITREELLAAIERAIGGKPKYPQRPSAKTILVVDDHDLNRELARSLLEHLGYNVLLAEDGDAAIALASAHHPALVFMDLAMPKKDGFAAARELKQNSATAHIPIVALTAMAMRGDEVRAFEAGMDDYLTKPIDRKALESVLAKFIKVQA